MESIETLQRIKELEESSDNKIKLAEEKASNIIKDATKKSGDIIEKAEKNTKEMINHELEKIEEDALKERETEINSAKKKAEKIKPLDSEEMLEIFDEVIKEAFEL
ncbi:MAG: putative V-type ATPase, G subunit [Candidatus Parvarchaeum acidophilus ARMAN-5]|uniref:Putative V-type ATPase, G subunit n=1 Tax=Candidatus Parvarchaeum acidophilus ARMAN-5 TaxID=662762 RepID=D6GVY2_PARA5|nr:MAG: putative V-type ATPase, G subunit [Candidatus Parvarchaeum acidophilus ARMAN-5]EFD92601.1 MAG: putative V-type ATPase, G subunit [Candidatus Parvarchaeum acidophilus ARMAN-5]